MRFNVHFEDGHVVTVSADNGTAAKADARRLYGVRKEQCKITRVEPLDPVAATGGAAQEGGR